MRFLEQGDPSVGRGADEGSELGLIFVRKCAAEVPDIPGQERRESAAPRSKKAGLEVPKREAATE